MPKLLGFAHFLHKQTPIKKFRLGAKTIWENKTPPEITNFRAAPNNIDLDSRLTGTIAFDIDVSGYKGVLGNYIFPSAKNISQGVLTYIENTNTAESHLSGDPPTGDASLVSNLYNRFSGSLFLDSISSSGVLIFQQHEPFAPVSSRYSVNGFIQNKINDIAILFRNSDGEVRTIDLSSLTRNSLGNYSGASASSFFRGANIDVAMIDKSVYTTRQRVGALATKAQVKRLPDGANIGPAYNAAAGSDIDQNLANISQPLKPTIYRLIAKNSAGQVYRDLTVQVTKNPTIANLRRTNFIAPIAGVSGAVYEFSATITGLPRPTLTYRFSGGQQGTIDARHFVQGSNPYTWTLSNWRLTFATAAAQSLTLTATNPSGSVTDSIDNISN